MTIIRRNEKMEKIITVVKPLEMINVQDVSSFLHVTRNILILVKFIVSAYSNTVINVMRRFKNTKIEHQ